MRTALPDSFPGSTFSFLPADIISQILNFGAPAPIDVQISGPDTKGGEAYAHELVEKLSHIAGIADVRLQQASDYPELGFDVDRTQADRLGITENDVTKSLSVNLAGSFQVAPAFWLNPKNGVSYPIVVQTPQYRTDSNVGDGQYPRSPVRSPASSRSSAALGTMHREPSPAVISHYAVQPAYDVYATTQGRDLGAVAADIDKVIKDTAKDLPKGATVTLARSGPDDEHRLQRPHPRPARRGRADLPPDRRELPILGRSGRDRLGAAGRAGRHRLDAVRDPHAALGAGPDRAQSCAWAWQPPTAFS